MPHSSEGRRDRTRRATIDEIRQTARELLVEHGSTAVTINAVARRMGISGPALYHYYPGRDALVDDVTAALARELTEAMRTARDTRPEAPVGERILATARALRTWAVTHPQEFGWVFASRTPWTPESARHQAVQRFEQVFLDLVLEIWRSRPFGVPDRADLPAGLWDQLQAYAEALDGRLPPAAAHVFLECWMRLYGHLCMEVFRQVDFAFSDMGPVFELCLRDLSEKLGFEYSPAFEAR